MSKIEGRLVSFGRPQDRHDIVLPQRGFPWAEYCYFDVNLASHAIMLHDVSPRRGTRLFRHLPDQRGGYTLSTDELDNSLSVRSCVVLPNEQYTLTIRNMKFLLIPVERSPIELKNFVATVPESYKNMATTTYLPPETNKDKEGPSESQTSHRLHSAHATIRHQFVKELGSGGEAVVNQYINLQDGNYYAGKIISLLKNGDEVPDHGQNSDNGHADALKKRVSEEVRALSKMRHDNVIVYNYTQGWETNHELRIFMPLYGTTLRKLLPDSHKRASGDWRFRVDRMIKDISSALEYIHEKDCLHRDLKPDNILVSSQSFCLTDFGMASFSTGNRKTESLPVKRGHTWQYAAPEVLRKKETRPLPSI
uniref:non-specific serine/threonine protein kinase n=1 Tax=Bionectria ochroleuca TaxID=29856 RepID=A0A8H7K4C7_BIOOC